MLRPSQKALSDGPFNDIFGGEKKGREVMKIQHSLTLPVLVRDWLELRAGGETLKSAGVL